MTAQTDPYVRVYYRAMRDPKFRRLSLAAWGLWTKLLIGADAVYPSWAAIPRWAEDEPLQELTDAGIVELDGQEFYTIVGLEAERSARSKAAAIGGAARADGAARAGGRFTGTSDQPATAGEPTSDAPATGSDRNPPTSLSAPLRSDPLRSEATPTARAGATDDRDRYGLPHITEAVEQAAQDVAGRSLSTLHGGWAAELDRLCQERGSDLVAATIRDAAMHLQAQPSWAQLVAAVRNRLEPLPRSESTKPPPPPTAAERIESARERAARLEAQALTGGVNAA